MAPYSCMEFYFRMTPVTLSAPCSHFGFDTQVNEKERSVTVTGCAGRIPKKEAQIYVGSAGTAARFLTAMLGMSDGSYVIDASEQRRSVRWQISLPCWYRQEPD